MHPTIISTIEFCGTTAEYNNAKFGQTIKMIVCDKEIMVNDDFELVSEDHIGKKCEVSLMAVIGTLYLGSAENVPIEITEDGYGIYLSGQIVEFSTTIRNDTVPVSTKVKILLSLCDGTIQCNFIFWGEEKHEIKPSELAENMFIRYRPSRIDLKQITTVK